MPKPSILSLEQFHTAAKDADHVDNAHIREVFIAEVKAMDGEERKLDFVISTDSIDRMGDTISVDGWKLANYRRNPQFLWAHNSDMPPIGKGSNVRVEDGKLKAGAEFVPADNPAIGAFAEGIYQLYRGGFLAAVSVGFIPIKYAFSDEPGRSFGIDFIEQELLEFSACPIPANPDALQEARSLGLDVSPIRDWAVKLLATDKVSLIPTAQLDAIRGLPGMFREMADKLPAKANGARGQILRCANFAERQINLAPPEEEPTEIRHATDAASMQRLEMARRRLTLISARA